MSKDIPDLNFDAQLSMDDFAYKANSDEQLLLERTKLVFGGLSLSEPRYGIIDQLDPRDVIESDINRPLLVTISEADSLRVDVTSGAVVCPNGTIVALDSDTIDFELARTNEGDVLVLFIENEIVEEAPTRTTRYGVPQKVRRAQSTDKLRSTLLSTFNNSSFFSSERKSNIVVIAIINVVSGISGLELQIDMTNNSYSFNRSWYSPVDVEHRSHKGSGVATSNNPHAIAFNDLSSGNLPFYVQNSHTGLIIATDRDVKGLPGTACEEFIVPARIQTDTTGEITKESRFGKPLAKYVLLAKIPTDVSVMHLTSHKSRTIAFDWVKGTRLIVLPDSEVFTEQATIRYNRVFALEAPEALTSNSITFQQPDLTNELIISEQSFDTIINPFVDFEGSGPIARNYQVYCNNNGDLISFPQIVQRTTLLSDVGSTFVPLEFNQFGPCPIAVGLADATPNINLRVVVRIFGKDANNVTITEDLVFDDTWVSPVLPAIEDPNNLRKTLQVFDLITGYQIIERENDGNGSKIVVYAEVETGVTPQLNHLALIATVDWTGLSLTNIRDQRQIVPFLPGIVNRYQAAAELEGKGGSNKMWLLTEDFKTPKFRDITPGFSEATASEYSLYFTTDIQAGDTIEVKPSKITIATAGSPNRALGEFSIGLSAEETRDDFILTLNSLAFNSGLVATPDDSNTSKVDIASAVLGARGNLAVTITTNIPNAITKSSDAVGGYDAFGEHFLPHHSDGINTLIPPTGTYDVTKIRNRYLSAAFPINLKPVVYVLLHGVKPPFTNVQVRMRSALETFDFDPWEVLTTTDGILYRYDAGQAISKIQIELFGNIKGYSIFESNS